MTYLLGSRYRNQVLLIGMLIIFTSTSSTYAVVPSGSTLTVGELGYAPSGQDIPIVLFAADASNAELEGASLTLQILVNNGADGSGVINGGGLTNQDAAISTEYTATNSSGYLVVTWSTPMVEGNAEIIASVTSGSDTYTFTNQIITLTSDVLSLDATDVGVPSNVYSGFETNVTVSGLNFIGGKYSNVDVSLSTSGGTLELLTGKLSSSGLFVTKWQAPEVITPQNVTISVDFQLVNSRQYSASVIVEVDPIDLEASSIVANSTATGSETGVALQIQSKGNYGIIPGTNGTISQTSGELQGVFSTTQFVTNSSGYADLVWTAPRLTGEQTITLTAILDFEGTNKNIEINITVSAATYDISVAFNSTTLDPEQSVEMVVKVSEDGNGVSEASVLVDASDGTVLGTQPFITNATGYVTVIWKADFVPVNLIGSNVELTISAFDNVTGTSNVVKSVHVNPYPVKFSYAAVLDKTEFTFGDPVDFSIVVLNSTNGAYEGALVTVTALAGQFASSNDTQASAVTDSFGFADFTWTSEGLVDPNEPQQLSFTYEVSISEFNLLESGSFTITILPSGTVSNTNITTSDSIQENTGGMDQNTATIIIGGVAVVGAASVIAVLLRRKG